MFVLVGIGLRVWAYAGDPLLYLDEILLSRNILAFSVRELLAQPLQLDQVAPRGFLFIEKLAVLGLGEDELVLRLFPFLCGLGGLFVFHRLAERALEGWAVPFAVGLVAIGIPFINYGALVKQYEVDATAAIGLALASLDLRERGASSRRLLLTGLAGFVVAWISQASVLVMGGLGLAFAADWLLSRDRGAGRVLAYTIPIWALASAVAVVTSLHTITPSTHQFMHDFWSQGFVPLPLDPIQGVRWFWNQSLSVFTDPSLLRYRWPALFALVALAGLVASWIRRRHVALILVGPLAIAVIAAALQQYPFRGRLIFYLIPSLLLAIGAGAEWIRSRANRLHPAAGATAMLALAVSPVAALVTAPPPYDLEHIRPVLTYLQGHRQPGDVIYVSPLSRIGVLFYGPRYGLEPRDWTTGICHRTDTRAFVRDVDRFRGVSRFWFLSLGARPFRMERQVVRSYLGTIGVRQDSLVLPSLIWDVTILERYDLSDTTRHGGAAAETFPVQPMPTDPRPGCRPWSQPSPLDASLIVGR